MKKPLLLLATALTFALSACTQAVDTTTTAEGHRHDRCRHGNHRRCGRRYHRHHRGCAASRQR